MNIWSIFFPYYTITSVDKLRTSDKYQYLAVLYFHPPRLLNFLFKPKKKQAVSAGAICWYWSDTFDRVLLEGSIERYYNKQKYNKQLMNKLAS